MGKFKTTARNCKVATGGELIDGCVIEYMGDRGITHSTTLLKPKLIKNISKPGYPSVVIQHSTPNGDEIEVFSKDIASELLLTLS